MKHVNDRMAEGGGAGRGSSLKHVNDRMAEGGGSVSLYSRSICFHC